MFIRRHTVANAMEEHSPGFPLLIADISGLRGNVARYGARSLSIHPNDSHGSLTCDETFPRLMNASAA